MNMAITLNCYIVTVVEVWWETKRLPFCRSRGSSYKAFPVLLAQQRGVCCRPERET